MISKILTLYTQSLPTESAWSPYGKKQICKIFSDYEMFQMVKINTA